MKKILTHFKRFFLFYIIYALVGTFAILWEFKILTKAKESEKLDLFICSNSIDQSKFDKFVNLNIPTGCKEVNTNYVDTNNFVFSQNLSTYGAEIADIYILSKEKYDLVPEEGKDNYFYKMDINKSKELFGNDISFYTYNEKSYAIKLTSSFFKEDEEMYIGFAKNTKHIYSFNGEGTDFAVTLVKSILANEKA